MSNIEFCRYLKKLGNFERVGKGCECGEVCPLMKKECEMFDRPTTERIFRENAVVKVVFLKKAKGDAEREERTMFATTQMETVDESLHPKTDKAPPEDRYPCIDVVANGWRSFCFVDVISMAPSSMAEATDDL
jgi:hypothetical protein